MTDPADARTRCPNCGALVGESAEWCGQCYASLRPEPPQPVPTTGAEREAEVGAREPLPSLGAPSPEPPTPSVDGQPTVPMWPCLVCDARNAMELDVCETCGTPFGHGLEPARGAPAVSAQQALVLSLLFPGLGHARLGRWADAVIRMAFFGWALGTAVAFYLARPEEGGLGGLGVVLAGFALAAVGIYAEAALDAPRQANGEPPLLSPRQLMWMGVALVVLTVLAVVILTVRSAGGVQPAPTIPSPAPQPVTPSPTPPPTPSPTASPTPSPTGTPLPGEVVPTPTDLVPTPTGQSPSPFQ